MNQTLALALAFAPCALLNVCAVILFRPYEADEGVKCRAPFAAEWLALAIWVTVPTLVLMPAWGLLIAPQLGPQLWPAGSPTHQFIVLGGVNLFLFLVLTGLGLRMASKQLKRSKRKASA